MATFKITVVNPGAQSGPGTGVYEVSASQPAVALKRLLDGGHQAGYKFATVGPNALRMKYGDTVTVKIERVS